MGCLVSSNKTIAENSPLLGTVPDAEVPVQIFQVVLLGDTSSGKAKISMQWVHNRSFEDVGNSEPYIPFITKRLRASTGKLVELGVSDTSGHEKFIGLVKDNTRRADAVLLVYNVADPASFVNCAMRMKAFQLERPDSLGILVGNTVEDENGKVQPRIVPSAEAATYARAHKLEYYETDTHTGEGISQLFQHVADTLALRKK